MNTRLWLIIFVAAVTVTVVSAVIGAILESSGTVGPPGSETITAIKIVYFALFCVLVFALIPLLLRFFISMQSRIGTADFFVIRWLRVHEKGVVYGFWIFCLLGLGIAVSAAIKYGFFT